MIALPTVGNDTTEPDVAALPLTPRNPLPHTRQFAAIRSFHTGTEVLRDAGGSLSRRRTIQPVFTKHRVGQFASHITEAAESVSAHWHDGTEIDLDVQYRALTLRALGRSVFGLDLAGHADMVEESFNVALDYAVSRRYARSAFPRWLPTPSRRRARKAAAALHRLADEALQACRSDPAHDAPLVQALTAAKDSVTGESLSDNDIRNELIIFLFAGYDTVATTIAHALWQVGRHPTSRPDCRPRSPNWVTAISRPATCRALSYTTQVIREALRICPPAPTGTRLTTRDIAVCGYRIEAGTTSTLGRKAVQCDPDLWDEPLTFDPDRFSPENMAARDRWHYLPFGGGPRSCIGDHFAMLEAVLALATLIRRFEIESLGDDFPLTPISQWLPTERYLRVFAPVPRGRMHEADPRPNGLSSRHPRRGGRRRPPHHRRTACEPRDRVSRSSPAQLAALRTLRPAAKPGLAEEPTRWAYYPWRRTVVGVLGPLGFRAVRLDRNRHLITEDEQADLARLCIGVAGLSVGHVIAHTLAAQGLCGALKVADFDILELSNLNRVPATVLDLGVNKATLAARRIAELDPYLRVRGLHGGPDRRQRRPLPRRAGCCCGGM